ncbi:carbohydrate ABC transporter substrate-binding protein (CUT1 family) [Hydrogenispora ethanolica]|jgi:multiple sugar transport system substrate-binding protein|uniref:Carbohydrate ABC transporter substrate-binding protein (CUT1 family) n=1 Tax=Hydrogenispora ethanolica TaxID=1082276 RepID=A0A4R1RM93_HYDET|nr:sugar ABC transporter substrate-binding protein [Hydrogenispora ethanolica]TCL67383.1 carbohydrate ABC transporter substrate-binding protein (CUT1 family) [Hydrogenispora ethanolica]
MKKLWRFLFPMFVLFLCLQVVICYGKAGTVTIRVMDWSDSTKSIREEVFRDYMRKHPNIKIEYTQLTIDQYKNTILTAVKSNDTPDLFPVPPGIKLAATVADGWYQPMNRFLDKKFTNSFIDGTFIEGTTMIGGKIYSLPEWLTLPSTAVFYNKKLLKEAGLDPEKPPKTYSKFREYAKKITEAGKGKYYGIIEGGKQLNRWKSTAQDWSSLGGSGLNEYTPVSLATGKPTFDSKAVLDTFELFKSLAEDKSFHPYTMNISAPEARALFAQGQAGFIVQGSWCIAPWKKDNPNLQLGVMAPPLPDDGRKGSVALFTAGAWMGLSAKSKHPKEAMAVLKDLYRADAAGYQAKVVASGAFFSAVKGVNDKFLKDPDLMAYYKVFSEYGRFAPDPIIRNPEIAQVFAEIKEIHPNLAELLQGTVAGAIKDPARDLRELSQKSEAELIRAVDAAKTKGAKVKITDFKFANWDPMKDYVAKDYAKLK